MKSQITQTLKNKGFVRANSVHPAPGHTPRHDVHSVHAFLLRNKKALTEVSALSVPPQGFEHIEFQTTDTADPRTCGQTDALTLANNILPFGFLTIIIRKPSRQ